MTSKSLVVIPQWKERDAFLLNKIRIYSSVNKEDAISYVIASIKGTKGSDYTETPFFEVIKKDDLKGLDIHIPSFRKYLLPYIIFYQRYEEFYGYLREINYLKDRFIKEHYIDVKIPIRITVTSKKWGNTRVRNTNKEVIIRLKGCLISEALKSYVQQQDITKLYGEEKACHNIYYTKIRDMFGKPIRFVEDVNTDKNKIQRCYLSEKYGFLSISPKYKVLEKNAQENYYWTEDRKHIIAVCRFFHKGYSKRRLSLYPLRQKKISSYHEYTKENFLRRRKDFVELLENMFNQVSNKEEGISFDEYINQWSKRLLREVSFKEGVKLKWKK